MSGRPYQPTSKIILRYLPSFCFQTAFEILTMLEGVDEDIDPFCVNVLLCRLSSMGKIERRLIRCPIRTKGAGRRTSVEYRAIQTTK